MNPVLPSNYDALWAIIGVVYLLAIAMSVAGFIFATLTMLATRRTAKATEELVKQVAEIKAQLAAKSE
ncbi:MAG: hypothetical protein RLZZ443_377 [Actinomycetota bacterium]|jgi:hypothetical protein